MENKLTNIELLKKLQDSNIEDGQKSQLAELIPEMTDSEKEEMLGIIAKSKETEQPAEDKSVGGEDLLPKNNEDLAKLNKEYEEKLETLVKDSTKEAYAEAEKIDNDEVNTELGNIENEIQGSETESDIDSRRMALKTQMNRAKPSKSLTKFIVIGVVLVLVAISAGILLILM